MDRMFMRFQVLSGGGDDSELMAYDAILTGK
jgi:hypothetical protein